MEDQAEEISSWGKNVNVKTDHKYKQSTCELIGKLSSKGIICNVTAIFTLDQVKKF